MKISEIKHNHSLTDLLKILLFSILMLAPFTSVAVRSLYVICNKNAYQSYSNTTEVKTYLNYDSVIGNTYIMNWVDNNNGMTNNTTQIIPYQSITITAPTGAVKFRYGNSKTLQFYDVNDTNLGSQTNITSFSYVANSNTSLQTQPWFNRQLVLTQKTSLDNVFEYSIKQLEQSNLFNWTKNTAIYSGIQEMTTQLGVTGQTIPVILTYWALLTIIYVIIDIILKCFTILTHMLGSKKA